LETGDAVMVHAPMRRLGANVGGAAGLIAAIDDTIGPGGTIVLTLGSAQPFDWVNEHPPADRAVLLGPAAPFVASLTPADPDVGVVPEVFRNLPGVVVNDHPDGRFAASGRQAGSLVADGPWNDYYGPGSLLERFVDLDGVVLRLGADDNTITLTHLAEAMATLPFEKRRVTRHHKVLRGGEPIVVEVSTIDDSDGICDYELATRDVARFPAHAIDDDGVLDEFAVILADHRRAGSVRAGTVGSAKAELIRARPFVRFAVEWIERNALHGQA
jgi:aminoglycoside N3'-acetyltransferase